MELVEDLIEEDMVLMDLLPQILILERELMDSIGAGVSIDQSSSTTGKLSIRYGSLEELDGLIERLRK